MKELDKSFLKALTNSFKAYNQLGGARSNKKLIPIHSWFSEKILKANPKYIVKSLGYGGEYRLEGKYYPKNLDITIFKNPNKEKKLQDSECLATISFKFVTSNYAQNSNNYFENLLGETANIRRVDVGFSHFLVLRGHTPYYDKAEGNKRGKLKKLEKLTEHNLKKYIQLFKDVDFPHKPDILGISIVDFDNIGNAYFTELKELGLSNKTIKLLKNEFSISTFMEKVKALCILKS